MKKVLFILSIFLFACSPEQALQPNTKNQQSGERSAAVEFQIQNVAFQAGQTVEAKYTVTGFTDLTAFQYAMQYDTAVLQYSHATVTGVVPDALYLSVNWEEYFLAPGEVRVAWVHSYAGGVTIPPGTVCYSLFFTAKQSSNLAASFPFWPNNPVFPAEASDGQFNILPLTVTYLPIPPSQPGPANPKKKKKHN